MDGQAQDAANPVDDLASLVGQSFVDETEEVDEQEPDQPGTESVDETEQDDEPADGQAANVEAQRIKLKLKNEQGEEVEEEYSPEEIANGFLREKDYRQKTMALAEKERQATQIVQQRWEQANQAQMTSVQENMQIIEALVGAFTPDRLETLKQQDPVAWAEAIDRKSSLDSARQHLSAKAQALQKEQAKVLEMQRGEMARSTWQVLNSSGITENMVSEAFAEHRKFYGDIGDVDYNNILDPVSVMTIRDAVAYRKLKAANPKTVKQVQAAPPMPKAKAPTHRNERQAKALDQKFASGRASLRDLGDFIHMNRK